MTGAVLSSCRAYRYVLQRGESPACAVVCLNPSTADAETDDATSRKLRRFASDWGYPGYDLFNVGAGRATDPRDWLAMADPVGPDNDFYLGLAALRPLVVVGWGKNAPAALVDRAVHALTQHGAELWCLAVNNDGSPRHPLYVPFDTRLSRWR